MGRKKNNKHSKKRAHAINTEVDNRELQTSSDQGALKPRAESKEETFTTPETSNIPESLITATKPSQNELIFENYRPISDRIIGREYFVHSLCQVCKEELSERVTCPKCLLIAYCCQSHLLAHWSVHADLCAAITRVCRTRGVDHILQGSVHCSPDSFRVFRFQNMVECEAQLERILESWEKEMFIFPNVCGRCYSYDFKNLVVCRRCQHSCFCKDHRTRIHDEWCEHLVSFKNIIKNQNKFGIVCPRMPISKIISVLPNLFDIKQVFKTILNKIDNFEFLELTEMTTYPFTTLNALIFTNKNPKLPSKITVHIVGPEANFELNRLEKWEYYVLHVIPELLDLQIDFVGPELNTSAKHKTQKVCSKCRDARKTINYKFHNQLYHDFCDGQNASKPELVCVFNPGLYRTTGFANQDSWRPSINRMFSHGCPVLITSYAHKEILLDVDRVKTIESVLLEKEPSRNPFSSMKPSLNFVSDEDSPVIFKNQFYCIMRKA